MEFGLIFLTNKIWRETQGNLSLNLIHISVKVCIQVMNKD